MQQERIQSNGEITRQLSWDLNNALRDKFHGNKSIEVNAFAYALFKAQEININGICPNRDDVLKVICDEKVKLFIEHITFPHWIIIESLFGYYKNDEIREFILTYNSSSISSRESESTPQSIIELTIRLLNIKSNDTVVDLGTGAGSFLLRAYEIEKYAHYTGIEIQTNLTAIAKIRSELLGAPIVIEQYDMFQYNKKNEGFDKAFSNYPFGMRTLDLKEKIKHVEFLNSNISGLYKAKSSDWIYNSLLMSKINKTGKAIGIMTSGSTWNAIDKPIRELFIRKGFIEAVISLPANLFDFTSVQTTLIILSHGNKTIRLIDAKELYDKGRRQNTLTTKDIDIIVKSLTNDSNISRCVTIEELANTDFIVNPARYLEKPSEYKNGVEFGSIIKNITRGAPLSASQLDELSSNEVTDYQYLMLSNIRDGFIDENLPYINGIERRLNKYCIKDGNLLISKNGAPYKIAVANCGNKKVLANGNLYIIELDENLVRPYYLKSFFESEQGIVALSNIVAGTSIPNIAVEQLRKMIIPLPDLSFQKEIEEKYLIKFDEVQMLQSKLEKAKTELKNIFEEGE